MLKLATIGTSPITEKFIAGALQTGHYELTAVYSRTKEKATSLINKCGFSCDVFDDLSQMLQSDIDVVYIASPNHLHFEQMKLCVFHKKHVICEKPLVTDMNQFQEIFQWAEQAGVYVFEAFRHIHTPAFYQIKEQLNEIGPIRSVSFSYNQFSSRYEQFKQGIVTNVFNPEYHGGALLDIGIYPVSLAVALWGAPKSVKYLPVLLENGVDGAGSMLFEYEGFVCNISFSKLIEGVVKNEIIGELGAIVFDRPSELLNIDILQRNTKPIDKEMRIHVAADQLQSLIYQNPVRMNCEQVKNDIQYEAAAFCEIIYKNDGEKYEELKNISKLTHEIITNKW